MTDRSLVVLAMSGGVDSSVAAALLLEQRYEVVGVFMGHGESPLESRCATGDASSGLPIVSEAPRQGCCTAQDAWDARRVAERFHIPFYPLDLRADFGRVMDYFADEYTAGRTPNPCVVCNQWLKFGKLFQYADTLGAAFVATGHYARCESGSDKLPGIWRGRDSDKDQSYALFGVDRHYLERILLPIGDFHKSEIRQRAADLGLRVAQKRDSQEICFVSPGAHAEFVRQRRGTGDSAGEIVTVTGEVVGYHQGIEGFTIGQRKGLGVAFGEPRYVVAIDARRRRVVIGRHEDLACQSLMARRCNWHAAPPTEPQECAVQIRYNSDPQPALIQRTADGGLRVEFHEPCYGVAPGQAAVCYVGDRVWGGGWIESSQGTTGHSR